MWVLSLTGAFGIVHKGEMISSDGIVKAVAIKTIKCKCVIRLLHAIEVNDMAQQYVHMVTLLIFLHTVQKPIVSYRFISINGQVFLTNHLINEYKHEVYRWVYRLITSIIAFTTSCVALHCYDKLVARH